MKNHTTLQRRSASFFALITLATLTTACGASEASDVQSNDSVQTTSQQETDSSAAGNGSSVVTARPDADTSGADAEETGTPQAETTATSVPTTAIEDTTTSSTDSDDGQVGEPFDFGIASGSTLSVVGVVWNDDLNFRTGPGTNNPVLTSIESIDTDRSIIAAGEAWIIDDSIWWKVTVDGIEAWASQRYLAAPGQSDNVFDEVAEGLGILKAETLASLAEAVANTRPAGGPTPRIVLVAEPLVFEGSGATVTVDILDVGDDALVGERLRITAALIMSDGDEPTVEAFVLTDVTRTILCGRGVQEGLCS